MAKDDFVSAIESEEQSIQLFHPKLANKKQGFNKLKQWIDKQVKKHKVDSVHLGVESTGGYEVPLVEWCRIYSDYKISILNPVQVKRFGQSKLIRTKTDKVDAKLIASFLAIYKPKGTPILPKSTKKIKELSRYLEHLTTKRASEKTYLPSVRNSQIQSSVKQTIKKYDMLIEKVKKQINDVYRNYPDLKLKKELLMTIPGVSNVLSTVMLSELNSSLIPKQQVAHAGLAPRERQSGSSVRGRARICKTGNKRIRTTLYMPTLSAIQYNPIIKKFYNKLVSKGKVKQVAVIACMRKLLHIIIGVLKNQVPFDPNYS